MNTDTLFLDDNEYRTKSFLRLSPLATTVSTAQETIDKLIEKEWDWVFLDHDLGDENHVDSGREDTGMEVVRWIEQNKPIIRKGVIVHTLNAPAGESMRDKLIAVDYSVEFIPFTNLITRDFDKYLQT